MKKLMIGSVLFIFSIVLFGMTLIAASVYTLYLTAPDIGRYDRELGLFGTALKEVGIAPLSMSLVLLVAGIYLFITSEPR